MSNEVIDLVSVKPENYLDRNLGDNVYRDLARCGYLATYWDHYKLVEPSQSYSYTKRQREYNKAMHQHYRSLDITTTYNFIIQTQPLYYENVYLALVYYWKDGVQHLRLESKRPNTLGPVLILEKSTLAKQKETGQGAPAYLMLDFVDMIRMSLDQLHNVIGV